MRRHRLNGAVASADYHHHHEEDDHYNHTVKKHTNNVHTVQNHHRNDPSINKNKQLQKEVINLQRLVRLQNHVIIGMFSCFVLVIIISTTFVIQHLPTHPNEVDELFWLQKSKYSNNNTYSDEQKKKSPQHIRSSPIQQKKKKQDDENIAKINCTSYGCEIRPLELSQLELQLNKSSSTDADTAVNNNNHFSSIASSNHILITHKSNRKKPAPVNQDRAVLISNFGSSDKSKNEADSLIQQQHSNKDNFFLGLFDGHDDNGHIIAQFASEQIPSRIASKIKSQNVAMPSKFHPIQENNTTITQIKDIITSTFIQVDNDVPITGGGTTANCIMRLGSTLFMSNTGDSTQFLVVYTPPTQYEYSKEKAQSNERYIHAPRSPDVQLHLQGSITIHYQNTKHKAHFLDEKRRIEGLGGKIHIPPKNPMGSRVIVRSTLHREDVGLAMSRSIGDWEWTAVGVIPDPDTVVVDLNEFWLQHVVAKENNNGDGGGANSEKGGGGPKVFAIVGSDGLFDARQAEFVARHLAYGLFEYKLGQSYENDNDDEQQTGASDENEDEMTFSKHLIEVGQKLVNMASPLKEEWYRDDITFVAKVIDL